MNNPATLPAEWPTIRVVLARAGDFQAQGRHPLTGYARILHPNIVAFYVDLDRKGGAVLCTSSGPTSPPEVSLVPFASLATGSGLPTDLQFPDYVGWSVFAAHCGSDTLSVVLVAPLVRPA